MDGIIEIKAAELQSAARRLSAGGRHPLAAMFGRDETRKGAGYAIYCLFELPEERRMVMLKALFPADAELSYESLTLALPAAAWYEREIRTCLASCRWGTLIPDRWCCTNHSQRIFIRCASQLPKMPKCAPAMSRLPVRSL